MSGCYKVFLREKRSGVLGTMLKGKLGERVYDRYCEASKRKFGLVAIAQRNIVCVAKVGTNNTNFGRVSSTSAATYMN